jgi:hypothetical protein
MTIFWFIMPVPGHTDMQNRGKGDRERGRGGRQGRDVKGKGKGRRETNECNESYVVLAVIWSKEQDKWLAECAELVAGVSPAVAAE